MDECKNCENKSVACIPFFEHENAMMHYNRANRRMLIVVLAVCITFVLTIGLFVSSYTVREKNWLDTLTRIQTEVQDGVHEQPD